MQGKISVGPLTFLAILLTSISGYLTHLVWVFNLLMDVPDPTPWGQIAIAAVGTFVVPIGMTHGIYLWF